VDLLYPDNSTYVQYHVDLLNLLIPSIAVGQIHIFDYSTVLYSRERIFFQNDG
jgi:hypothetical protein